MKSLGLVVNPIAGMGGAVGLKGTDGKETLEKAIGLGAKHVAYDRAARFLRGLKSADVGLNLLVGAGKMGESEAKRTSLPFKAIGERKRETTAEDTKKVAKSMIDEKADVLAFCGGDGTARDLLDAVNGTIPVLGIPTGVKMHSAVFAVSPESAARILIGFLSGNLPLREAEVMDIDEEVFREGRLSAKLYGYLLVPYEPNLIQAVKMASPVSEIEIQNQAAIAIYLIEEMKPDIVYVVGPGTTTRIIGDLLDEKKTLLGVDLFYNKRIIASDVSEREILEEIKGREAKIIVTPIGGQGFILGRGNQQISASVIKKVGIRNLIVVATKRKLNELRCLRVDTGDPDLDKRLQGHIRVITDYREESVVRVA